MVSKRDIATALGAGMTGTPDAARFIYIGGTTGNNLNEVIGDAITKYRGLVIAPYALRLSQFTVRTVAKETTANATIDVLKAASGTAITSGTAMATQLDPDTLVNATNKNLAINTDGTQDLAKGDLLAFKVVSGAATSTLKHISGVAKLERLV